MPPIKDNRDGTLTISAPLATWAFIIAAIVTGGSGYLGFSTVTDRYTGAQAEAAWNAQYLINREIRKQQAENDKVLTEIRTDIKWIKQALQKR